MVGKNTSHAHTPKQSTAYGFLFQQHNSQGMGERVVYVENGEGLSCDIRLSKVALTPLLGREYPALIKQRSEPAGLFCGQALSGTLLNPPHSSFFLLRRQGMIHEASFRFCVFLFAFYILKMYSFMENRTRCWLSATQCRESQWMWLSEHCVPVGSQMTKKIRTKAEGKKKRERTFITWESEAEITAPLEC